MNAFQKKLLDMFKWFHQFCVDNNLRYYALGGTMLGAMRHQGFIPWDDDIDIGMPRQDYKRLEELMNQYPNEQYILETPNSTAKDYCYPYSKLFDTSTTLVENQKYKIKRGLYIDIFPLDGLGYSIEETIKHYKNVERKRNLLLLKTSGIRRGRSIYKNALVLLYRIIPINERSLTKEVSIAGDVCDFDASLYSGNTLGAWRYKEVMETAIMGKPTLYHFEDTVIYGAEYAEKYLEKLYGEWEKLPPREKQKTHHEFLLCDLEKSWLSK